jgi:hypothetical protein
MEEKLRRAKVVNDGLRDYQSKEDESYNKDGSIRLDDSDDTHLHMTYKTFDIVGFERRSFSS